MNKKIFFGLFTTIGFIIIFFGMDFNLNNHDESQFIFVKQIYSGDRYEEVNNVISIFEKKIPDSLNNNHNLPHNVSITFKHCSEIRSYYDSNNKDVIYCYEFLEETFDFVEEVNKITP